MPAVVALGGGHGLARALAALRNLGVRPTAVVTVADDGGSSGRLRQDLNIIAPGDLRMALLALARNRTLAGALTHRFPKGQLAGHALGNLFLVALAERADGDFVQALDTAAILLDCEGRVLPATTLPVSLEAKVGGEQINGQARVTRAGGRVERIWLEPSDPPACPEAERAIDEADAVVLAPGSLFTSIAAVLLVPQLAEALARTSARVVMVANVATQTGETDGLDLAGHVDNLLAHAPGVTLDTVIAHDGPCPNGVDPLGTDLRHPRVGGVRRADVITRREDGGIIAVHDPRRLAAVLAPLLGVPRGRGVHSAATVC
ncbi:MAG: uridine diphosphate-N-acetylglucosamine-binding protein YvcK [Nitriliruptorales bacterium]|nr:uridine diphosphate-N-acetylglucosamine-binding protein YvcK [Nitriliruptorales bacterium]